jgi:hypothetical protein
MPDRIDAQPSPSAPLDDPRGAYTFPDHITRGEKSNAQQKEASETRRNQDRSQEGHKEISPFGAKGSKSQVCQIS